MILTPGPRKFVLTVHVVSSVGWFGAVASFLALAVAGLISHDTLAERSAYLAMNLIYLCVIIPIGFASLLTGLVSSLGTEWGLFRHYWVLVKFLMTVPLSVLLLVHAGPVAYLASLVAKATFSGTDPNALRIQLLAYAAAALFVLVVATTLSTYKPRGKTGYSIRKRVDQRTASQS